MRYEVNLTPYRIKSVSNSLDQTVVTLNSFEKLKIGIFPQNLISWPIIILYNLRYLIYLQFVTLTFQITWSRMEDTVRPYSLLTIGDQNYVEDKRFLVARPLRGLTNVSTFSSSLTYLIKFKRHEKKIGSFMRLQGGYLKFSVTLNLRNSLTNLIFTAKNYQTSTLMFWSFIKKDGENWITKIAKCQKAKICPFQPILGWW